MAHGHTESDEPLNRIHLSVSSSWALGREDRLDIALHLLKTGALSLGAGPYDLRRSVIGGLGVGRHLLTPRAK